MKFFEKIFLFSFFIDAAALFSKQRMTIYAQYDKIVVLKLVVVFTLPI